MDAKTLTNLETGKINTMYDIVEDILTKTSGGTICEGENFEKFFTPYMLCRYLSMRAELHQYAEYLSFINSMNSLSNRRFYKLAYNLVPKTDDTWIAYIKKSNKIEKQELQKIQPQIETSLFNL